MNNLVEIKYAKSGKYPEIFINGEIISRYMTLSDHIYDDIFRWADSFFDIIDSELAEEYRVVLTGHKYHMIALEAEKSKSEFLSGIEFNELQYNISIDEKYEYACRINGAHNLLPDVCKSIRFNSSDKESLINAGINDIEFTDEPSDYGIDMENPDEVEFKNKFSVRISESNRIKKVKGATCLYVTRQSLPELLDYFNKYHIRLAAIDEVFTKLAVAGLDDMARLEYEAYNTEEYRILVSPLPSQMEAGEEFRLSYDWFPKCYSDPGIKVSCDDMNVISYANGVLSAKDKGTCVVAVFDGTGNEVTYKSIEVLKHNYATNITIVLPDTTVKMGETLRFRTIVTPNDAEDADQLTYKVSDEKVAVISAKNELYALSSGRISLTVSTPRVSRTVYISVPATVQGIQFNSDAIEVPLGSEATVYCAPVPRNADPVPHFTWYSTNRGIVNIKKNENDKCVFVTENSGTAYLVCKVNDTDIEKKIEVTVPKPKGCYVATAVYGSYNCPEVWVLRRFRDNCLDKTALGRCFISAYYFVSPTAVRLFGKTKWFNRIFRKCLDKMVTKLQKKGYEDTPYRDI